MTPAALPVVNPADFMAQYGPFAFGTAVVLLLIAALVGLIAAIYRWTVRPLIEFARLSAASAESMDSAAVTLGHLHANMSAGRAVMDQQINRLESITGRLERLQDRPRREEAA